ncbi:MAG: CDP-glycerol glycerophosphotransferase family protein [bacterium]
MAVDQIKKTMLKAGKKNHHIMSLLRKGEFLSGRVRYLTQYVLRAVDDRTVLFEAYQGRQYSCSPRAIYEAMVKSRLDYHYIWVVDDLKRYAFLEKEPHTTLVLANSSEYYKAYAKAKYWVVNSKKKTSIFKREKQVYIQCWHGTPLKKIGCDLTADKFNAMSSIEEIHESYRLDAMKYDYLISPSPFASQAFISAFDLKGREDIIVETGYPRNDALHNYTKADVRRIREELSLPQDKKVILYAPTWRDNQHDSATGYTYALPFDLDALRDALADDYVILLRVHYLVAEALNLEGYEDFIYDVSNYDDINALYIASDLLVTDYSSILFDYANLKKPMFFYMYDYEFYKQELRDFYLDLDVLPGPISYTQDHLVRDIRHEATYAWLYKEAYARFNATFNPWDDGQAAKRVIVRCIVNHDQ